MQVNEKQNIETQVVITSSCQDLSVYIPPVYIFTFILQR